MAMDQKTIDGFAAEWNALRADREELDNDFIDLKSRMEAALKQEAECEDYDYGEPFKRFDSTPRPICNRHGVWIQFSSDWHDLWDRICCLLNAMQGIADPARFVADAKALREQCRASPLSLRETATGGWTFTSLGDVRDWLRTLAELCK